MGVFVEVPASRSDNNKVKIFESARPSTVQNVRDRLFPLGVLAASLLVAPVNAHAAPEATWFENCLHTVQRAFTRGSDSADLVRFRSADSNRARKSSKPGYFSGEAQEALVREFAQDARPILVVTDAHYGQKSGVVTVMQVLKEQVEKLTGGKVTIKYIMPDQFKPAMNVPYQDLIVSYMSANEFKKILADTNPQAVHVMVEGTTGRQAQSVLNKLKIPYTTAYHTMFPEYARDFVKKYFPLGAEITRRIVNADLRNFHRTSSGILVPTDTMARALIEGGYNPDGIRYWSHGVDEELFHPSKKDASVFAGLEPPISMYIGRVAVEKNITDFLKMDIPGTKVIIGDGPELEALRKAYPKAVFMGRKNYKDLPVYYASADMFVFPSLTDTFGLVQLEAAASGTPVVAYSVQGPIDVITSPTVGRLVQYEPKNSNANVKRLETAWKEAIKLDRIGVRAFAEEHTWRQSTLEFMYFLRRLVRVNP